jgi:hypothetical protein
MAPEVNMPVFQRMTGGSLTEGVLLSAACQAAAFFGIDAVVWVLHISWLGLLWGVTQWCFVIPLFRSLKRQQRERSAQALLIASYAGIALNAGFIWMLYDVMEHPNY